MAQANTETSGRSAAGWIVSVAIVLGALLTGAIVLHDTVEYPRTDDAELFANFIGIAPLVEGPVMKLYVHDNQFVKQGELLYEIDDRPYLYTLQRAESQQAQLEGQIRNESRSIAAQRSGVSVAAAGTESAAANVLRMGAAVDEAEAGVKHAEALLKQAQAEFQYSDDNLHRLEPLLSKQYVTADQVDRARSSAAARAEAVRQAEAQVVLSRARMTGMQAQQQQASADVVQSHAQLDQSAHAVSILDPLVAQREGRAADVRRAQYDFESCRVYAPFNARVTILNISEGAYAHVGTQLFTLMDTRVWWAVANLRETQLDRVRPGMRADVYVMSKPDAPFKGIVESVAYGVTPDADVLGTLGPGLPNAQRTLNWVHLASRYPVRVRVENPVADLFRVGETAVVVTRGGEAASIGRQTNQHGPVH